MKRKAPKVHRNMPFKVYQSLPGLNKSTLFPGLRSMAHLRAEMLTQKEPTEAMLVGAAFHCLVTEKDKFPMRYLVAEPVDRRTKEGKEYWAAIQASGLEVLTKDQYLLAQNMADSVLDHPLAKEMLASKGDVELAIQWTDSETQMLCKCRLDYLLSDATPRVIVDLKSTRDARKKAFERSILDYGYHVQAAMYSDAVFYAFGEMPLFVFIAVEKEPPYCVSINRLYDQAIEQGRKAYRGLLAAYKECEKTGIWPGYPAEISEIDLPSYFQEPNFKEPELCQ